MSAHPELRHVNDGGYDAPLTPRGRLLYRSVLLGLLIVFVALFLATILTR